MKTLTMTILLALFAALINGCAASSSVVSEGVSKPFSITTEFLRVNGNGTGNTVSEATENAFRDASAKLGRQLRGESVREIRKGIVTDTLQVVLKGTEYFAHLSVRKAYKLNITPSRITIPKVN